MNTSYKVKEAPADLIETAKQLNRLMKAYDPYSYSDADYTEAQALDDLANDPYMVIQELMKIIWFEVIE